MNNNQIELQAEKREPATKGTLRTMRLGGRVPAVTYGDSEAPIALSVDERALQAVLRSERGRNALISLKIGDGAHAVLLKEIQRHPITRALWHVDFQRVSLKRQIETLVPIHVKGEAPGVKLSGGVLEHIIREARVRCLPTEIPAAIDVDVSALQIGQSIKARELQMPSGVDLLIDAELVVVNVVAPTILEETPAPGAAAAGAAATAEPEVIKKGKVEEGAEGAAAAPGEKKAAAPAKAEAKKPEGK
jgi:large subunit ribosomal protein L25